MANNPVLDLYTKLELFESMFKFDSKILNDINFNLDELGKILSPEQVLFIRYLVSIDISNIKVDIKELEKELLDIETKNFNRLFETELG